MGERQLQSAFLPLPCRASYVGNRYHLSGVHCFAEADDPLAGLDLFSALGVRMSQLTYIQDNQVGCSWLQENDKGLKPLGKRSRGADEA